MIKVHDSDGNDIGHYDGRFVYDRIGTKCYWIEEGEVFSLPPIDRGEEPGTRAAIKIATLTDGVALDDQGKTIFTL